MTQRMRAALVAFESAVRDSGSDLMDLLAPGLTDAEIDDCCSSENIVLTSELRELWRWHDGSTLAGNRFAVLGPLNRFVGLSPSLEIVAERRLDEPPRELDPYQYGWRDDWVVVFRHREHIVATWGPQDESEMWRCDPYGNLRIAGSLAQIFEDHAVAVRAGWWGWSRSESAWSFDYDAVPRTSTVHWM